MSVIFYENLDNVDFNALCNCGHELYRHAFTSDYQHHLYTSQCTVCGWTEDKDKKEIPICPHFTRAGLA